MCKRIVASSVWLLVSLAAALGCYSGEDAQRGQSQSDASPGNAIREAAAAPNADTTDSRAQSPDATQSTAPDGGELPLADASSAYDGSSRGPENGGTPAAFCGLLPVDGTPQAPGTLVIAQIQPLASRVVRAGNRALTGGTTIWALWDVDRNLMLRSGVSQRPGNAPVDWEPSLDAAGGVVLVQTGLDIELRRASDGALMHTIAYGSSFPSEQRLTSDGKYLLGLVSGKAGIYVWSTATGALLVGPDGTVKPTHLSEVSYALDQIRVFNRDADGLVRTVTTYELPSGLLTTKRYPWHYQMPFLSDDGQYFVGVQITTSGYSGFVRLHRTDNPEVILSERMPGLDTKTYYSLIETYGRGGMPRDGFLLEATIPGVSAAIEFLDLRSYATIDVIRTPSRASQIAYRLFSGAQALLRPTIYRPREPLHWGMVLSTSGVESRQLDAPSVRPPSSFSADRNRGAAWAFAQAGAAYVGGDGRADRALGCGALTAAKVANDGTVVLGFENRRAYVFAPGGRSPAHAFNTDLAALSDDGQSIAVGPPYRIVDLRTGSERPLVVPDGVLPELTPNLRFLWFNGPEGARVYRSDNGQQIYQSPAPSNDVPSPDGELIAFMDPLGIFVSVRSRDGTPSYYPSCGLHGRFLGWLSPKQYLYEQLYMSIRGPFFFNSYLYSGTAIANVSPGGQCVGLPLPAYRLDSVASAVQHTTTPPVLTNRGVYIPRMDAIYDTTTGALVWSSPARVSQYRTGGADRLLVVDEDGRVSTQMLPP